MFSTFEVRTRSACTRNKTLTRQGSLKMCFVEKLLHWNEKLSSIRPARFSRTKLDALKFMI